MADREEPSNAADILSSNPHSSEVRRDNTSEVVQTGFNRVHVHRWTTSESVSRGWQKKRDIEVKVKRNGLQMWTMTWNQQAPPGSEGSQGGRCS